jgi:hypothetical protein
MHIKNIFSTKDLIVILIGAIIGYIPASYFSVDKSCIMLLLMASTAVILRILEWLLGDK